MGDHGHGFHRFEMAFKAFAWVSMGCYGFLWFVFTCFLIFIGLVISITKLIFIIFYHEFKAELGKTNNKTSLVVYLIMRFLSTDLSTS